MALQRTMDAFDDLCRAPFVRARIGRYPPGWTHRRHLHPYVQILLVLGGRLELQSDAHALQVESDGIAVLPAQCPHAWSAGGSQLLTLFDCCVAAEAAAETLAPLLDEPDRPLAFPAAVLRSVVEQLEREAARRDLQVIAAAHGLLWQFVALAARARRDQQRLGLAAGDHALLEHLDAFLEQRMAERLQLDDLAAAVHCSPQHLCRVVRRERGSTPMGLLAALRLRHAQRQLLESERPVKDVAEAVGFADPQHFSRWFRQQTGHSPSAFREGQ